MSNENAQARGADHSARERTVNRAPPQLLRSAHKHAHSHDTYSAPHLTNQQSVLYILTIERAPEVAAGETKDSDQRDYKPET